MAEWAALLHSNFLFLFSPSVLMGFWSIVFQSYYFFDFLFAIIRCCEVAARVGPFVLDWRLYKVN